jgi:hypothetical protein
MTLTSDERSELYKLRDDVVILRNQIQAMQTNVEEASDRRWSTLAIGWLNSALCQRITDEKVDQTSLLLGVLSKDIEIVRKAYRTLVSSLKRMGKDVTEAEDAEVKQLLADSGLIDS